jgi:hypothetical protein
MTDHRATDLSYGHLGEASYEVDDTSWHFSRELIIGELYQVKSFDQCSQLSLRGIHTTFTTTARMHGTFSTSPSNLEYDSFKNTLCTKKVASQDLAGGWTCKCYS